MQSSNENALASVSSELSINDNVLVEDNAAV
jgi:hypothetical protein